MTNVLRSLVVATLIASFAIVPEGLAQSCPSRATITIESSGYSGGFSVELRRGNRPGSTVVASRAMQAGGSHTFTQVCPGRYFYSFGTPDSDQVSVTQYFDVRFDGKTFSNPSIRVFYSRSAGEGQTVGSAKKKDL